MAAFNPYAPPAAPLDAEPSPVPPRRNVLATRRDRLLAAIIDVIAVYAILAPVFTTTGWLDESSVLGYYGTWAASSFVVWLVLNAYTIAKSSQSLGKRLVGVQIVDIGDGRPSSFVKIVFMRKLPMHVLQLVPMIGQLASLVGLAFIFGPERRCIHDEIAGTKVVDLRGRRALRL
jgi:uncharacterized RDD family membrane protein YckC